MLRGRSALIVEDEMMVLFGIEEVLAEFNFVTTAAATVDQALALLRDHSFDVAVLDLNLDGEASYQVADALAERGIPYVFSSGYGALPRGGSYVDRPFLKKPYSESQLLGTLTHLLDEGDHASLPTR